jgi:hypothetical protein
MTDPSAASHGSNGAHALDAPTGSKPAKGKKKDEVAAPRRTADVVTYEVLCESLSPLLMDRWDEQEMVDALVFRKRTPADTMTPLEERCVPKIYRTDEGGPMIPAKCLIACLNAAARSIKIGKEGKLANASDSKLFAVLDLKEIELPLIFSPGRNPRLPATAGKNPCAVKPWKGFSRVKVDANASEDAEQMAEVFAPELDPESPWRVDVQRGVGEQSGVPNAIIRPCFEDWSFKCTIEIDYTGLDGLTPEHIQQLFDRAGKRVGLLSYNPAHKGPYGRFKIASFKELSSRSA